MKRRFIIVLCGVLVLGGMLIFTLNRGPAEPVYQGFKLGEWMRPTGGGRGPEPNSSSLPAINAIGGDAVPWLLAELNCRDGALRTHINDFARRRNWKFRLDSRTDYRHSDAIKCFWILGTRASNAIPVLVARLGERNHSSTQLNAEALLCIAHCWTRFDYQSSREIFLNRGVVSSQPPEVLAAVRRDIIERVIPVASDPDLSGRIAALHILGQMTGDSSVAVPLFLKSLQNTNETERTMSAWALGRLAREPATVIPALITALNDPDSQVQMFASSSLKKFPDEALAAVPAFRRLSTNGPDWMRIAVLNALHKIDPEGKAEELPRRNP